MTMIQISTIDDDVIERLVAKLPEPATLPATQREKYKTHSKTKSLILRGHVGETIPVNSRLLDMKLRKIYPEIEPFVDLIKTLGYGTLIGRILIVWLPPHENIPVHQDYGKYLTSYHRIHIPLVTNEQVIFYSSYVPHYAERGNVYYLHNQQPHAVSNNSDIYRIHLIIDVKEDE